VRTEDGRAWRRIGVAVVTVLVLLLIVNTNLVNRTWQRDVRVWEAAPAEAVRATAAPTTAPSASPTVDVDSDRGSETAATADSESGQLQGGGFRLTLSPLMTSSPPVTVVRGAPDSTGVEPTAAGAAGGADSLFIVAFQHQQAGRHGQAVATYERALQLDPDHVQAAFNLAYALVQRGRSEDAERAVVLYERALNNRPDYTEILFRLGEAHELGRDPERAADHYRRYLALPDGHPDLRRNAESRLARLGTTAPDESSTSNGSEQSDEPDDTR
jgi:tetratricopeptide (TPR) repeat protein